MYIVLNKIQRAQIVVIQGLFMIGQVRLMRIILKYQGTSFVLNILSYQSSVLSTLCFIFCHSWFGPIFPFL